MLMGALSGGFLCSLLGGCVVVPAVGFPGSVLRGGCWWPWSWGPLCLLLIAGGEWPSALITEHDSCKTCTIYFAHTHAFIYPVTFLLYSCCVVLWFQTIHIYSYMICTCCWCCSCLCFFCCFVFVVLSVCLLAPDGSLPGFPTEPLGCFLFGFYRCSS